MTLATNNTLLPRRPSHGAIRQVILLAAYSEDRLLPTPYVGYSYESDYSGGSTPKRENTELEFHFHQSSSAVHTLAVPGHPTDEATVLAPFQQLMLEASELSLGIDYSCQSAPKISRQGKLICYSTDLYTLKSERWFLFRLSDRVLEMNASWVFVAFRSYDGQIGQVNMPAAALSCCEYARRKPPPLMYMKQFDRISKRQLALVESYRVAQAEHCKLGRSSMALLLEANKAFAAGLGSLEPESWQTGLEDCGDFYMHRWKELIRYRLGHNDHDRNSVREYNTRFTLPMELKHLEELRGGNSVLVVSDSQLRKCHQHDVFTEGLTPMAYCLKYCIISNNRQTLYQRTFGRMHENRRPRVSLKFLADAISGLLGGTLEAEQAQELFSLLEINADSKALTVDEFCVLCALAERFYYHKNLRSLTEETQQMQRGVLEAADFHRFSIRLHGINLLPSLSRFLDRLIEAGTGS
ncbi:hypothetical protein CLF_104654 [Clonorchis sinensis]|uniref:EF-hand domain-containing protein n=1 Tax=Clonorchis sinensis TaxID=79923 RepID=G7YC19_CLOSI|nr:hypothetical protein CLF_104654 [Clonorchis sinensis]